LTSNPLFAQKPSTNPEPQPTSNAGPAKYSSGSTAISVVSSSIPECSSKEESFFDAKSLRKPEPVVSPIASTGETKRLANSWKEREERLKREVEEKRTVERQTSNRYRNKDVEKDPVQPVVISKIQQSEILSVSQTAPVRDSRLLSLCLDGLDRDGLVQKAKELFEIARQLEDEKHVLEGLLKKQELEIQELHKVISEKEDHSNEKLDQPCMEKALKIDQNQRNYKFSQDATHTSTTDSKYNVAITPTSNDITVDDRSEPNEDHNHIAAKQQSQNDDEMTTISEDVIAENDEVIDI
jgi:hypothetical protein